MKAKLSGCGVLSGALAMASGLVVSNLASAATLYDSGGYDDTTRFNPSMVVDGITGNLRGQDAAVDSWKESTPLTATNAVVESSFTDNASRQAIRVNYSNTTGTVAGGDQRWAPTFSVTPGNNTVSVAVDLATVASGAGSGNFGPFFGTEYYGTVNGTRARIGGYGVDSTTGELIVFDAMGIDTVPADTIVPFGQFEHLTSVLDYSTSTYSVYLNDVLEDGGIPFETTNGGTPANFTDAPITALQIAPVGEAATGGTGYFDNYVVTTSVPEPASVAVVGFCGMLLGSRRKRR